jgi:hypothetical protein
MAPKFSPRLRAVNVSIPLSVDVFSKSYNALVRDARDFDFIEVLQFRWAEDARGSQHRIFAKAFLGAANSSAGPELDPSLSPGAGLSKNLCWHFERPRWAVPAFTPRSRTCCQTTNPPRHRIPTGRFSLPHLPPPRHYASNDRGIRLLPARCRRETQVCHPLGRPIS